MAAPVRLRPNVVVRKTSPNCSQRTAPLALIVLHSTEGKNYDGITDLAGLGSWFANTAAQVSAHVATDGDGNSGRYVADGLKAWHCAAFNSPSLGIEQVGFAADSRATWFTRRAQLRETARWIAHWSILHGIPIRIGKVNPVTGQVLTPGVVRHMDLGTVGGGHHDPGVNFPFRTVLYLARFYKAARLGRK